MKHPMQHLVMVNKVIRFQKNPIVKDLLEKGPFTMNSLAGEFYTDEDREQFAQLIGYSVSGFGDLSYVSEELTTKADVASNKLVDEVFDGPPEITPETGPHSERFKIGYNEWGTVIRDTKNDFDMTPTGVASQLNLGNDYRQRLIEHFARTGKPVKKAGWEN